MLIYDPQVVVLSELQITVPQKLSQRHSFGRSLRWGPLSVLIGSLSGKRFPTNKTWLVNLHFQTRHQFPTTEMEPKRH